jgi:Ras-related protein Rab-5C
LREDGGIYATLSDGRRFLKGHPMADIPTFKVAFIGPCSSGKTSIINRLHSGTFSARSDPTVGAGFITHEMSSRSGQVILHIWDTAGQERYRSVIPMYCRGAAALVLVFDLASSDSFRECGDWLGRFVQIDTRETKILCLVANKTDLEPATSLDDVKEFAATIHAEFFATSAKTGEQIDILFQTIADAVAEVVTQILHTTVNLSGQRRSGSRDNSGEKSKQCC